MKDAASPIGVLHASNLLTYASLLASVAAIASALNASAAGAGALIALSVVLDTFDGRFARRFHRTDAQRAIGVQLDSLSDAIAFGIAPAICMAVLWLWGPASAGPSLLWWLSAFAFAASAITRLAFYNVTCEERDGFVGMPVPVAALIWSSALLVNPGAMASALLFLLTAAAMMLPIPFPRPRRVGLAVFVCWPLLVIAAHLSI